MSGHGHPGTAAPVPTDTRAVVVTCSTRAAEGVYPDRGGAIIVEKLRELGLTVDDPTVVPDGPDVAAAIEAALAATPDLLVTTGGTGLTPTDGTPEATAPFLTAAIPGIAEAIRAAGVAKGIPSAMLSRGLSGLAGRTLVVNLPGSSGGVRDALEVLEPILGHALAQVRGSDHG